MICSNIGQAGGRLTFAGRDTVALAEQYGTPLYLMDEQRIRHNCRVYKENMDRHFTRALPLYASKALACRRLYEIVAEEGLGTDVVSPGELYLAKSAGFPMERVFFHGNAKTDADILFAMGCGVGYFVVDNPDELSAVDRYAGERGIHQKILLRVTPGIDPHTFEAVSTGKVDSKFGIPIETGQALEFVQQALGLEHVQVMGLHAHVGSQVFASTVFYDTADIMLRFLSQLKEKLGWEAEMLNLGGGYGVRYTEQDPTVDIGYELSTVGRHIKEGCARLGLAEPMVLMEPGRSIVADAGMTLYTVQSTKRIPGYRSYVAIDGGMTDNPRYALYRSAYTVYLANKMDAPRDFVCTVGGRCCESGDMIQENVPLPEPERGDILAVCTTGAYNYSMSSNYNSIPRPPIVMVDGERDYVAVRRETFEDLAAREV